MRLAEDNRLALGCLAAAAVSAAAIWWGMPHDREVSSAGMLLLKLLPFVLATLAIAACEVEPLRRLRLHLVAIPAAFLVFFCFFVPRIFFYSGSDATFPELYYHVLTATPLVILSLAGAFRLGGGAPGQTMRLAFGMLLLMLSGLEDLAFLLVNPHTDPRWTSIPEVWTWASHMKVFIGHAPTKYQAYGFIAVHTLLASLVLFLPARAAARPFRRLRAVLAPARAPAGGTEATRAR